MHVFYLFLTSYHILKELRQLHFNDKRIQWPAVEQVLKEVAPPSDEFIKQVREQLTISFHKEASPPSDEFIRQVKEQLMISFHMYKAYLHQEIPQQPEQESWESCIRGRATNFMPVLYFEYTFSHITGCEQ